MESGPLLRRYLRPVRGRIGLLLLLLFTGIGLEVWAPQLMRRFLDQAQVGMVMSVLLGTAVLFFGATVVQKLLNLISIYISEDLGWRTTNELRLDLTNHILQLDMGFHKLKPAGELIERIDGDISNLAEYFSQLVVQVLGNLVLALAILVMLFREDWRVGLLGTGYGFMILFALRFIQKRVVRYWTAVREAFAQLFGFLEERFGGLEDIRANGGEPYMLVRLHGLMKNTYQSRVRAEAFSQASFITAYMLYGIALTGSIWIGARLYLQGEMTAGTIVLLITYIGLLEKPFNAIRREAETFQRAVASIQRIDSLFAIKPKVQENQTAVLPASPPIIRFDQVSFRYKDKLTGQQPAEKNDQSTLVLDDVSFELRANHTLGLLGRTGSGKTTITRLLFRLYDVDKGSITFDGIDIRNVALEDLRQYVGLVTQDVQLFAATIRDNLTLFRNYSPSKPPIPDQAIIAALTTLGLDKWYRTLPDGLDTWLQTGGKGVSAGEAQLIALTRVFLRNPQLVILDEASSRLDPATEQLLEQAIGILLQDRTGIIIAHRLATVQRVDDVLILENGRVQEHGDRIVLANNPDSRFAQLLRTGKVAEFV